MECTIHWMPSTGMGFAAETGSGHLINMDGAPEGGGRGLEAPPTGEPGAGPRFWLTYTPGGPRFTPVRLVLSRLETRNAASQLSGCKVRPA